MLRRPGHRVCTACALAGVPWGGGGLLKVTLLAVLVAPGESVVSHSNVCRSTQQDVGEGTETAAAPSAEVKAAPCTCEKSNPGWVPCSRTVPKCVFIDLGAANGNTFDTFLGDGFGPLANCPGGRWEAHLVEANPRFRAPLQQLVARFPGQVHALASTAAFSCEGTTSFYLDTQDVDDNFWGSSLSRNHPDVQRSGMQNVQVRLMNLNRLLHEHTIADDWVVLKMDIEGAEHDILPCLSRAPSAALIDQLFMEEHPPEWSLGNATAESLEAAKARLKQRGVDVPPYFSETL